MNAKTILETLTAGPAAISILAKATGLDHEQTRKILRALIA